MSIKTMESNHLHELDDDIQFLKNGTERSNR